MKIRAVVALLFLLLLPVYMFAQSKRIKISGNVRDADGNPVELVAVQVKNTLIGGITDEKGFYSLSVSPGDSIVLLFSSLGYNKAERIIPKATQDMRVNVQMNSSFHELDVVNITATSRQTTTMETIDANRLKILPDPSGGSIESLVVTYAGVSSSNELSSQYSVRGGSYDENIVYVNGMEVFRPLLIRSGEQEGLSFINPNMTEKVQFSAGGFEAQYGDRMSSVLDITYKQPKEFEASATVSLLGVNGYVGSKTGNFTQVTGIRYKTNRSLLGTMDTDAEYNPEFVDFQTYMTYKFSPRWEMNFLGNISLNNFRFVPHSRRTSFGTIDNPQEFYVTFTGKERDKFQTFYGAFTLKNQLTEKTEVGFQAFAFNSREEESYDISGRYRMDLAATDEDAGGAQSLATAFYHEHARNKLSANVANVGFYGISKIATGHTLKYGLNVQFEDFKDKINEWEKRDSAGYSLPNTGEGVNVISNLFSDNSLSSRRFSGYVQDVFKFRSEKGLFTLVAGVRGSYWDFNKEFIVSPRASIGFIPKANQDLTFRFATGLYYQSPFYKELRIERKDEFGNDEIYLNKDLKSQRSIHFILGGDYAFRRQGRNFKFSTEVYYKNLSDLNPYTIDNVKVRYYGENCAKGYVAGIDMKFFGEFVPGTDSWLSVSLLKAEQTIKGEKERTVPLPNSPTYNVSLYFQDYFPGYKHLMFNLKGVVSGGILVTPPGQGYEGYYRRTPAYRRVDAGLTYHLSRDNSEFMERGVFRHFKNIWLGLDVFNLLDISNTGSYYWITDVYNNPYAIPNYLTGRQLNLRVSVDF